MREPDSRDIFSVGVSWGIDTEEYVYKYFYSQDENNPNYYMTNSVKFKVNTI